MHIFSRFVVAFAAIVGIGLSGCGDTDPEIIREFIEVPGTDGSDDGDGDTAGTATGTETDLLPPANPVIYQLSAKSGPTTGGTVLAIIGAGFHEGAEVLFGDNKADVVKFVDTGRLGVVAPAGVAGAADVTVRNLDGGSGTFANGFTYFELTGDELPPPNLLKAVPNSGPVGGGTVTLINGDHFQSSATLFFDWKVVPGAKVTSSQWASLITPSMRLGAVDIAITNPDGQSHVLQKGFNSYDQGQETKAPPQISSVHPAAGSVSGGLIVTVKGSNLQNTILILGGVPVETWEAPSAAEGTFETPPHAPGLVDVAVTDTDGQSAQRKNAFLYYIDPPVIYSVTPDQGPLDGGNLITLNGDHFREGMTVPLDAKPCTGVTILAGDGAGSESKQATCTAPAGDQSGPVLVAALNTDGLIGQLPNGYTYLPDQPQISHVVPDSGPIDGGLVAVVVGADLPPNPQVFFGGTEVDSVLVATPDSISVLVPPHAGGSAASSSAASRSPSSVTVPS